jgi:hypothetical protein
MPTVLERAQVNELRLGAEGAHDRKHRDYPKILSHRPCLGTRVPETCQLDAGLELAPRSADPFDGCARMPAERDPRAR